MLHYQQGMAHRLHVTLLEFELVTGSEKNEIGAAEVSGWD